MSPWHRSQTTLYHPRSLRHPVEAQAASAAGGRCSARTTAGGLKPCRPIGHVLLLGVAGLDQRPAQVLLEGGHEALVAAAALGHPHEGGRTLGAGEG